MERDEQDPTRPQILETMKDFAVVKLPARRGLQHLGLNLNTETRKPYEDLKSAQQKRGRVEECVERVAAAITNLKEGITVDDSELLSKVMVKLLPEEFKDMAKRSKS
eukprot:sb/3477665/